MVGIQKLTSKANVLNVIDADIGPDPNIYLATLINTLIKGVGLLLVGSISDVLGRRYFIVGGQAFGLIGACVAATAKNVNTLIAANLFIGIGGATQVLYPLLIMEIVPNKYRGAAQSAITFSAFPSMGLGPAFARMMVEYTELRWRWVYWLNAITVGTSLILFLTCYFPPNAEQLGHRASKLEQAKQIDYVGFFLYAGGLISLLLALGWGGRQYAWDSAPVIATLAVGVVVLVAFTLYGKPFFFAHVIRGLTHHRNLHAPQSTLDSNESLQDSQLRCLCYRGLNWTDVLLRS